MPKESKKTIILYHGSCPDGFTAAWVAWKKFKNQAEYQVIQHNSPPSKNLKRKTIFLLDFCYPAPEMKNLAEENEKITVIDHHITAEKNLRKSDFRKFGNLEVVFDKSHSGTRLAWDYFHPKSPPPLLVSYIEDGDLWLTETTKRASAREILSFINAYDFDFLVWNKLEKLIGSAKTRRECVERGKLILQYENKIIGDGVGSASAVNFAGRRVLASNYPILRSEIGHKLLERKPPISIIWREKGGRISVSLRSDGSVDVAALAEKYGGGGHKSAAGFTLEKGEKLPWSL